MSVSSNPTNRPGATGSTGTDASVKPVKPRGHLRDDVGLLILRIGLAAIMIAHGLQKVLGAGGVAGQQAGFAQMGIPYPQVAAIGLIVLEIGGGVAILFGLLTSLVGILYAAAMAGAVFFVHLANGFFVQQGGYEFAGLVGVAALTLAVGGAGRLSLDRAIFGARRRRAAREAREAGVS